MWMTRPLDDLLSSPAKVAVLRALVLWPRPLSGREIGRRAGVAAGHVSRVLRELHSAGVLEAQQYGRVIAYALRSDAGPLVGHLRELFRAEEARDFQARQALAGLVAEDSEEEDREVLSVILFGSEARGEARPGSDTDVLFIVRRRDENLEKRIADLCDRLYGEHRTPLEPFVTDLAEVREWEESGNPFWKRVQEEGVVLAGIRPEGVGREGPGVGGQQT